MYYGFGTSSKNFPKYMYWESVWWTDYLKETWDLEISKQVMYDHVEAQDVY